MGLLFTIGFTYAGFACLSLAIVWNANLIAKLKGVGDQWRAVRGAHGAPAP
mgnify:CR=1 FL=1